MKKLQNITAILFLASLFGFSLTANALVIDFIDLADNPPPGEGVYAGGTFGTVTLDISAESIGGLSTDYVGYLDEFNAGLGVCKTSGALGTEPCAGSPDDNVDYDEILVLDFNNVNTIREITFRNGNHGNTFASDADFFLSIDGGAYTAIDLNETVVGGWTGTVFRLKGDQSNLNANNDGDELYEFYVGSLTVPEPITLLLLGMGLIGLGAIRRV